MAEDNKKREKLKKLLEIAKDGAIVVHDEVVALEEKVDTQQTETKEEIKTLKEEIREDNKDTKELITNLSSVERLKGDKGEQGNSVKGDTGKQGIEGKKGKDGEKGKMGEKGGDGQKGEAGGVGEQGERGDKGEDGKDVDEEKIKDLEDKIKELKGVISNIPRGGHVGAGKYVHIPMVNVFTGDGSTKVFTLDKAPKNLDTVKGWGSDFPFILVEGSDGGFTITGKVLTLNAVVDAPSLDARLVIEYYI